MVGEAIKSWMLNLKKQEVTKNWMSNLKKQVKKAESKNKILGLVVADLEEDLEEVRLQRDLLSEMSEIQKLTIELLTTELDGVRLQSPLGAPYAKSERTPHYPFLFVSCPKAKGKGVDLEAIAQMRDSILVKVEKVQQLESEFMNEAERKKEETRNLKKKIKELEEEINSLKSILKEKDMVIGKSDVKERAMANDVKQKDWVGVGGLTIVAIAAMGVACFVHGFGGYACHEV